MTGITKKCVSLLLVAATASMHAACKRGGADARTRTSGIAGERPVSTFLPHQVAGGSTADDLQVMTERALREFVLDAASRSGEASLALRQDPVAVGGFAFALSLLVAITGFAGARVFGGAGSSGAPPRGMDDVASVEGAGGHGGIGIARESAGGIPFAASNGWWYQVEVAGGGRVRYPGHGAGERVSRLPDGSYLRLQGRDPGNPNAMSGQSLFLSLEGFARATRGDEVFDGKAYLVNEVQEVVAVGMFSLRNEGGSKSTFSVRFCAADGGDCFVVRARPSTDVDGAFDVFSEASSRTSPEHGEAPSLGDKMGNVFDEKSLLVITAIVGGGLALPGLLRIRR